MSVTPGEQSRRASYGRGVIEGLRMAGVPNPGDFMNAQKLARIESGLNSIAKKVLEAVPISEPWTKSQIVAEMRRAGSQVDMRVLEGCLSTLADSGAIKEPTRGSFVRVVARQSPPQAKEKAPVTPNVRPISTAAPAPSESPDTLTRLANLGALLRRAADECDAIALEVEDRVKTASQDGEKLRQFQALLKSISA